MFNGWSLQRRVGAGFKKIIINTLEVEQVYTLECCVINVVTMCVWFFPDTYSNDQFAY